MTGVYRLDWDGFLRLPRAVAIRVLSRLLRRAGDGQKPHDLTPIEGLADRLRANSALKRTSLHGCLVMSDGTNIVVEREPGRQAVRQSRPGWPINDTELTGRAQAHSTFWRNRRTSFDRPLPCKA